MLLVRIGHIRSKCLKFSQVLPLIHDGRANMLHERSCYILSNQPLVSIQRTVKVLGYAFRAAS